MSDEEAILGEWRQVSPDPAPASISVTFASDGSLRYRIETTTTQHILLTWRIDGDTLITAQPGAPREQRARFRFAAPSRLVLELNGEEFEYDRV